jgi:hypothetical protein
LPAGPELTATGIEFATGVVVVVVVVVLLEPPPQLSKAMVAIKHSGRVNTPSDT